MTDERLPDSVSDAVAAKVRALRKAHGWLAADLAARCSLSENVIENIEHGRRKHGRRTRQISVDELVELARALEVGVADLLPGLQQRDLLTALDVDRLTKLLGEELKLQLLASGKVKLIQPPHEQGEG